MKDKSQFFKTGAGRKVIILICYAIIIFLAWLIPEIVGTLLCLPGVYFGWKALDRIQPIYFIWLPIMGWFIYIIVKLMISCLVGILVIVPYKIGNKIFEMIQ